MKNQIYTYVGLIIVLTISSVTAIQAQTATGGGAARANIPFDFSVRNQTVSSGDYEIRKQNNQGSVWSLRTSDNRQSVILLPTGVETKSTGGNGKLTFRRYGNKYFLVGIETSAYKMGLGKSRAEKNLEKMLEQSEHLGKNKQMSAAPEIVTVEIAM